MGNVHHCSPCSLVGRDTDLKALLRHTKLKAGYRLIQINGSEKVGKSRVIKELIRRIQSDDDCERKLLYQDVNLDVQCNFSQKSWVKNMCKSFGKNFQAVEQKLSDQRVCEFFKEWFIDVVAEQDENVLLFLDNVDSFMKSPLKDNFLDFLNMSLSECSRLQIVLTTSIKLKLTQKTVIDHEVRPLGDDAVMCLLHEVTNNYYKDCELEDREMHNDYLEGVARLCEGRPQIAITAGVLLLEDDYLLEPRELLELMISCRRRCLSPYNCPSDERMEKLGENFKQLDEEIQTCFKRLSRSGPEATIAEDSTFAILNRGNDSISRVKQFVVKKLLDHNLMKRQHEDRTFELHGVVRENVLAPTDSDSEEGVLVARTNALKLGLTLTEDELREPRLLEAALKDVGRLNETALKEMNMAGGKRYSRSPLSPRVAEEHEEKAAWQYAADGQGNLTLVETTCTRDILGKQEEVGSSTPEDSLLPEEHEKSHVMNTLEDLRYDSRRTISVDDKAAPFSNTSSSIQPVAVSIAVCAKQPPSYHTIDPTLPAYESRRLCLDEHPAGELMGRGTSPSPYVRPFPQGQAPPIQTQSSIALVRPEINSLALQTGPLALTSDRCFGCVRLAST
ncbi:uncharacterized protein LOC128237076 [Mya arenaria]|uniref:uncharacterized protein LOC128237076 n=1 Tax=Mya arenaria TaxID=6604 RepID=UPI0022DF49F5|nr:uncharacterized protein LOC128237076 [Mya arenaria]